jgi:NAD(P)-dependent dehydrogenase (short-subunit alcohol dehydrogenase family)
VNFPRTLRDRVAVITGAGSGIGGRAIVCALADRGAHVVVINVGVLTNVLPQDIPVGDGSASSTSI